MDSEFESEKGRFCSNSGNWDSPGLAQDSNFINKRIENARQPFTIFQIIKEQQQSLTGSNLTAAFFKLSNLTCTESVRQSLRTHKVFKEMMLTAAQNSILLSDYEVGQILWSLADLDADPPVEIVDSFMCSFYSRMEQSDTRVMSMVIWSLGRLGYIPAEKVLVRVCQTLGERIRLRDGKLSDFCSAVWGLAVMNYVPAAPLLQDLVSLSCSCLGSLTPMEVAQLLWSFIQFEFNPGQTFLNMTNALFCGSECIWRTEETSMLLWGMATLGYPLNRFFVLKAIDKVESEIPNCQWTAIVRTLGACARFCFHPGEEFLKKAASFLANTSHDIYCEAIETILWSYATFSFHPGCDLLSRINSKVDGQIGCFGPLQLANILWCLTLFENCTAERWNSIVGTLMRSQIISIPPEAFFRIFQSYLLKSSEGGDYDLPLDIKEAGMKLWLQDRDNRANLKSPFFQDVYRILLSMGLQSRILGNYVDGSVDISFFVETANKGLELIEEHEFTVNTTEPIGSAIMRTKLIQAGVSFRVEFLKFTEWRLLLRDSDKSDYLRQLIMA